MASNGSNAEPSDGSTVVTAKTSNGKAASTRTNADAAAAAAKKIKNLPADSRMAALINACIYKKWELLDDLVTDPAFCRLGDGRGLLPLHMALKNGAPDSVITALLATWPGAATAAHRRLPHPRTTAARGVGRRPGGSAA